jgi:hypothetical protein
MPNPRTIPLAATPLLVALIATGCTPVQDTVGLNVARGDAAASRSTNQSTLLDDGSALSAVNPNGQSYASLGEDGMYTLQQSPFGAAAIGARGAFASDPKNTSFGRLEMEFTAAEAPVLRGGEVVATAPTAVPARVVVTDFNADLSAVIAAQVGLAAAELEKLRAMEETERSVYLEEIRQRGALYASIVEALARAAGL